MTYKEFTYKFGSLVKKSRISKRMSLQSLSIKTGIVSDQIQKIESAKHGGILIDTYVKLLSGLDVSLSFTKEGSLSSKLIPISNDILIFIDELFLGLSSHSDDQFLNMKHTLLIKTISELLTQKRKSLNLTQKQLAKKANISNTTLVHIEGGEHNFRLATLHKIAVVLNDK
jgi:transcriptional regulator with XRE-family HTH domain